MRPEDILYGGGNFTRDHPGNRLFRKKCSIYHVEYRGARAKDRFEIRRKIIDALTSSGSRFLERNDAGGSWTDITNDSKRVHDKISQRMRDAKRCARDTVPHLGNSSRKTRLDRRGPQNDGLSLTVTPGEETPNSHSSLATVCGALDEPRIFDLIEPFRLDLDEFDWSDWLMDLASFPENPDCGDEKQTSPYHDFHLNELC